MDPRSQASHAPAVVDPATYEYLPFGQSVHWSSEDNPFAAEYFPGEHSPSQEVCPGRLLNFPGAHSAQGRPWNGLNLPGGQPQ